MRRFGRIAPGSGSGPFTGQSASSIESRRATERTSAVPGVLGRRGLVARAFLVGEGRVVVARVTAGRRALSDRVAAAASVVAGAAAGSAAGATRPVSARAAGVGSGT